MKRKKATTKARTGKARTARKRARAKDLSARKSGPAGGSFSWGEVTGSVSPTLSPTVSTDKVSPSLSKLR